MMNKVSRGIAILKKILKIDRRLDEIKLNQGVILTILQSQISSTNIRDYEFKIFSQWGEDGIIQYIVNNIEIKNKTFIEFGVEDFSESNCRFLMQKNYWSGYVIDGSSDNIENLRNSDYFWKNRIVAQDAFITKDNIRELMEISKFDRDLGLLSVDIDGVDYHVLEALDQWTPRIIIVEFNALFGFSHAVTVPYKADFQRSKEHHSNLYYGASLGAFRALCESRGYGLVGTNSAGSNAFFVRRDLLNDRVREGDAADVFCEALFREARDQAGSLTFESQRNSRSRLYDLPLIDVITGNRLTVRDLEVSNA